MDLSRAVWRLTDVATPLMKNQWRFGLGMLSRLFGPLSTGAVVANLASRSVLRESRRSEGYVHEPERRFVHEWLGPRHGFELGLIALRPGAPFGGAVPETRQDREAGMRWAAS
jgi:hypothetical protein